MKNNYEIIKNLSYRNKRYKYILITREDELMQAFIDGYKIIGFKEDKAKVHPSTSKKKSKPKGPPAWFKAFEKKQDAFNNMVLQFIVEQKQFNQFVLEVFKINNLKQPK